MTVLPNRGWECKAGGLVSFGKDDIMYRLYKLCYIVYGIYWSPLKGGWVPLFATLGCTPLGHLRIKNNLETCVSALNMSGILIAQSAAVMVSLVSEQHFKTWSGFEPAIIILPVSSVQTTAPNSQSNLVHEHRSILKVFIYSDPR